ncbi:MAG TPA: beta-ketoacyl synthase N-terminal-like domain-containing protein, partial [Candidatus Saccharimonadales bacterium]|nr:beta-ketoacyl synthase N-terminal-like domain-containing protein [Candidatus Saccharimonadales bacterium]
MSERRRVWITGIGIVTAIGTGVDAFRAGLRAAASPVRRIDRFDPSPFRSQVAAQVDDFDPLAWMPPKTARQLDRFSQFGMVAGRLALDDARLTPGANGAADPERIGI